MQSVSDVIEAVGGVTAVSRALGKPVGTVSAWKTRESIPSEQHAALVDAAQALGRHDVTFELIARLHAAPSPSLGASAAFPHNAENTAAVATASTETPSEG